MGSQPASTRRLSLAPRNGRVVNLVADMLRHKLTVPEIYLKPRLPGFTGVDLLAVDHAGSGDIHGVEIAFGEGNLTKSDLNLLLARLKELPLHFKYLALPESVARHQGTQEFFQSARSFALDGLGRLGLISYPASLLSKSDAPEVDIAAKLLTRPERYLLRGDRLDLMERFIAKAKPDMFVRV